MQHLTAEQLVDLADSTGAEASEPHLAVCAQCRGQLDELRATLALAADVDVPEPSPLFWDHFSKRVRAATVDSRSTRAWRAWWAWKPARVAIAAVVVLAVVAVLRVDLRSPTRQSAQIAPTIDHARDELAAPGDDPSLALVADLTADLDADGALESGLAADGSAEHAVTHMSDDELRELRRLLKEALGTT